MGYSDMEAGGRNFFWETPAETALPIFNVRFYYIFIVYLMPMDTSLSIFIDVNKAVKAFLFIPQVTFKCVN